jgi:hypothetical protein
MPTMAPDQRAALELVLRQGRSYGELAELLGMPEDTIRTRARGGVTALAPPGLDEPADSGEISDWLLGQRDDADLSEPAARAWAAAVASALRMLPGGERVPAVATDDEHHENGAVTVRPDGGASRLGGALLIGGAVILVAAVLAFVLLRDKDGGEDPVASSATPAATATATPANQLGANDLMLKGPAGSTSLGVLRLFEANDGTVRFALAAQGVDKNNAGQRYSIWMTKNDGAPRRLVKVQQPVTDTGELTAAGPDNADVDKFPEWLSSYDAIVVSLDDNDTEPGKVILKGDLPHSQQG